MNEEQLRKITLSAVRTHFGEVENFQIDIKRRLDHDGDPVVDVYIVRDGSYEQTDVEKLVRVHSDIVSKAWDDVDDTDDDPDFPIVRFVESATHGQRSPATAQSGAGFCRCAQSGRSRRRSGMNEEQMRDIAEGVLRTHFGEVENFRIDIKRRLDHDGDPVVDVYVFCDGNYGQVDAERRVWVQSDVVSKAWEAVDDDIGYPIVRFINGPGPDQRNPATA